MLSNQENKYSKRIIFQQRAGMCRATLIIIYFDGVIGEPFRTSLFGKNDIHYYLRNSNFELESLEGIQWLMKYFQIAIIFGMKKKNFEIYNNYFSSKGIKFDAIYKRNKTYNLYLQDYSQILFDFNKLDTSCVIKKVAVILI